MARLSKLTNTIYTDVVMSGIESRIAALSPEQRALLERRIKAKNLEKIDIKANIILTKNKNKEVLSCAQERLWILHQLQPELPSYNEINLFKLTGNLDRIALEKSFNRVLERHEILRSQFINQNGEAIACLASHISISLPIIEAKKESEVVRLAQQEAQTAFDLSQSPLFKLELFQTAPDRHYLLIVVHHIICDGWSVGIFVGEVVSLYAAITENKLPFLPELAIQYADFAVWERQQLEKDSATVQLDYWKQQLSGNLPILEIPSLAPKTNILDSSRGAIESILLPLDLSQKLKQIGQQENATLFMTLLAAFKVLLNKYTGLNDILVGSPIANRSQPECEDLIGVFLNTLVLRSNLANNPSFRDLLQQVKQVSLEAYANQDLPFERLVQELQPERNLSQSPLFQVMFILHNFPESEFQLPGLNIEELKLDSGVSLFDLTLEITERDNGLDVCFEYNCDRFSGLEIQRLLRHYQTILETVVVDPDLHLSQIDILTETEKQKLLVEFNDNSQDYPVTETIQRLFEAQAAKTPDAIVAVFKEEQLTYEQLNLKANQVARLLQNLGIRSGEFVGIYQQRSLNFLIAILGVIKAGGVYIPLDSTYPTSRIEYMLFDSQVRFLLVDSFCSQNILNLPEGSTNLEYVIGLDSPTEIKLDRLTILGDRSWQSLATDNLEVERTGIDPAYMIYTSGSTGKPKGTIIRHGGAINHIYAQYDALKLGEDLTFLQSAPASSDISVWQFLAPILIGGKTVIIDKETICNPEQLFLTIQEHQITLVELVPVVLKSLLNYLSSLPIKVRELSCLQWMMVTGESVSVDLVNQWLQLDPTIPIVNAYGPSEASDDITQAIIDRPLPVNTNHVSIGKPLANLNLYILDRNQNLLPVGVPGEICVSGYGVGMGYWRNEEKTQASFIPNPFPTTAKPLPGVETDLLYKTGDLGRWLPNGSIEYLGRIDNQVKIRGFRIELGEIEAQLRQHPEISDCVVIARADEGEELRLAAYYLATQSLKVDLLREFLKSKLPDYMIPAVWMKLETFPLTPNGKIDRNSLPIPNDLRPDLETQLIAPQNEIEKILAQIWSEILSIEQIGIHDNFFELGGDSILSIKVISKANEKGLKLTPIELFKHQTIFELSQVVEETSTSDTTPNVINDSPDEEFSLATLSSEDLSFAFDTVEFEEV